ncbi:MAG: methyltransferase domain-containing protein, partial [Nitrosopumilaceae archaeon]|nr:class I SAM-dependent methyltransferase [Nitrosopumilaceae archaeon]NIT99777.1 class I SAM-dependent methyltransferase [Nitrosopumilaceae archaeon]NIU88639.1 methyltransferase domain-containing protein [Nitrosopumilaceae archaeon]NIV64913.1 methyltransferase domain-containing protein [Nitrosopumilaceae archaeon]NIX60380.1 methyltransferase domain-containing protein [Nitrosopumilaceae archaeon]
MDKVEKTFDSWAKSGRAELMEEEHYKTVSRFLDKIQFKNEFTFLDIGCGNGWVIRKIANLPNCKKAVGIDKSSNMIKAASSKKQSRKEVFYTADIETWNYKGRFDYIFSMESMYYVKDLSHSLSKIYKLLKQDGEFFCGTDYYKDNKSTAHWSKMLKLDLHLLSKSEWKKILESAGFKTVSRRVKDRQSK